MKINNYYRKTIDYYKIEVFLDGQWHTLYDSTSYSYFIELQKILNRISIKYRGCKYRKQKTELDDFCQKGSYVEKK